jgi:hypothetical protein
MKTTMQIRSKNSYRTPSSMCGWYEATNVDMAL